jgi:hypothetical protein
MSLMREDVAYHGAQTAIDPLSFEIALASCLSKNAGKVLVPDLLFLQRRA